MPIKSMRSCFFAVLCFGGDGRVDGVGAGFGSGVGTVGFFVGVGLHVALQKSVVVHPGSPGLQLMSHCLVLVLHLMYDCPAGQFGGKH